MGDCTGDAETASWGCNLITTLLGLFSKFYVQTYTKANKDGIRKDEDGIRVTPKVGSEQKVRGCMSCASS